MTVIGDSGKTMANVPQIARKALSESKDAEALPIILHAIGSLDVGTRAAVLGQLLASLGPLALAVVGRGAFAKFVPYARAVTVPVSPDDAARATPDQIAEVVQYVRQTNPEYVERLLLRDLSDFIARRQDADTTDSVGLLRTMALQNHETPAGVRTESHPMPDRHARDE